MRLKMKNTAECIVMVIFFFVFLLTIDTISIAATDPVTSDHPLWIVFEGDAVVDGVLDDADWGDAFEIVRTQAWRDDGIIMIRMMYSSKGIYLSAEVDDENLWADGTGSGEGNRWEVETDDSVTFYFDPDNSRDEYFADGDRAFGVNLGNTTDEVNGSGTIRRWKYVKGTGAGGAPDVISGGDPASGTEWKTVVSGTVNTNSDTDTGWVTEMFIPWDALNMSAPTHGETIGMNFDVIFDNDGGTRNFTDNRDGDQRFTLPAFVDDHVQGAHSSYTSSQAGIRGPVNYAEVMFIDGDTSAMPAAITNLSVTGVSAYGARMSFTSPTGTTGGNGHVSAYEIRYSTSAIADASDWSAASTFKNNYVPRLAGLTETLRIAKLSPSTTYYIAVRGLDAAGNLGNLSNSVSVTTSPKSDSNDQGRIIPSPTGSSLMYEDGTAFVPVGEHLGLSWGYFRNLYPGDVWDPTNNIYQNYNEEPSYEGKVGPHLDELFESGVNTLRMFLEVLNLDQTGNSETPRGRYWIEYPAGTYNSDMKQCVLNALEAAGSRGIYLIFSPFDTFSWDDVFEEETPWYTGNGGPLSDIDEFYQDDDTITMAKARLKKVMEWVEESAYSDYLLGWEPMNEWDSFEWTLNSEGDSESGRETEMRTRADWIIKLNAYVREQDPNRLVFSSSTVRDPRGPLARALFYDRSMDVLAPHFYTNSSEEPINNPDSDTKVMPAVENALLTNYWLTHRMNLRPVLNGEWGMTRVDWPNETPEYSSSFTQAEDEALYRTVSWSGLATGQAGPGLRIAVDELSDNLFSLSDGMRDVELTISNFVASSTLQLDFTGLGRGTLAGNIDADSDSQELLAWGVTDGEQGLAYVLQDGNQTSGTVSDGELVIKGLDSGQIVEVEFWSTDDTATSAASSLSDQFVFGGTLTLDMTSFDEDIALKFKATAQATAISISSSTGDGQQSGYLSSSSEIDMLYFTAAGPGTTVVSFSGDSSGLFKVYDSDGSLLGTGSDTSSVSFSATEKDSYYVVVYGSAGTGSYTINADGPDAGSDDHADASDWSNATVLSVDGNGNASDTGQFEGPGDTDLFKYTAGGTGTATFSVSGGDAIVKVYDSVGLLKGSGSSYQMSVLHTIIYYILVESSSGTGTGSYTLSVSGPNSTLTLAAKIGGFVIPSADDSGNTTVTTINGDGDVIVITDSSNHTSWSGLAVSNSLGGPKPTAMSDTWVDPKDKLLYVASPSSSGLILYVRSSSGEWSMTNLTEQLGGSATAIVSSLTHFITPDLSRDYSGELIVNENGDPIYNLAERDRNNVNIAGLNADGDLVIYKQNRDEDNGTTYWSYTNITSDHLKATSQSIPAWIGDIIGYATPWNGQNIAGLDSDGEIIAVWTAPDRGGVWATTNLSESYGTPQLDGGLSVYVNWGINLTGVLSDGSLGVTWWSAQYEQEQRDAGSTKYWAFTNLTNDADGPLLDADTVANYTTPNWASNNIVGISQSDEVIIYWWTPDNGSTYGQEWMTQNLTEELSSSEVPAGKLSAIAPKDSTFSIFGVAEDGDVLRFFYSGDAGWTFQNVTTAATQ